MMSLKTTDLVMQKPNKSNWEHGWFTKQLRLSTYLQGHLGTMLEIKTSLGLDQTLLKTDLEYLTKLRACLGLGITPAWVQGSCFRPSFFWCILQWTVPEKALSLTSLMELGLCRIRHFSFLLWLLSPRFTQYHITLKELVTERIEGI